jgi:hypothetical protein
MNAKQLPIPNAAESDSKAIELVRVWVAHGGQHVSLATNVWSDPAAWGIMLVDLAKHIASAYQQRNGDNFASILKRIREGLDAEWNTATDEPSGNIQD